MRTIRRALPLLRLAALLAVSCGPLSCGRAPDGSPSSDSARTAAVDEAASPAAPGEPARAPDLAAGTADSADPLAGTWYALAPSHPYLALRLNLVATQDEHALEGHWISFDWRATTLPEALVRRSKAVLVLVSRAGTREAPGAVVVDGAMPMLDENNAPNGQNGTWHIELTRASLPGEPLRFRGRGVHSTLTAQEGVDVDLVRDFRAWTP
jgi:hypothetical protein